MTLLKDQYLPISTKKIVKYLLMALDEKYYAATTTLAMKPHLYKTSDSRRN